MIAGCFGLLVNMCRARNEVNAQAYRIDMQNSQALDTWTAELEAKLSYAPSPRLRFVRFRGAMAFSPTSYLFLIFLRSIR